jgi:Electron transfer DM13
LLLLLAGAAAAGGIAVGVALTRGGAESALAQGPPGVLARGDFKSLGWGTTGSAEIVRDGSGHLKLRFNQAFRTQPVPELFVYLAKYRGKQRTEWKQVGALKRAWGKQVYNLPGLAAGDLRVSVTVYCGKCNRISGAARLHPVT